MAGRSGPGLVVRVCSTRAEMAQHAATVVGERLRALRRRPRTLHVAFAAAPSQAEFLVALRRQPGIPWPRIVAFQLDEYLDLSADAPQRFASWLDRHLFQQVPLGMVHRIDTSVGPDAACARYEALLRAHPLDIACVGIGDNGHLAFNDPPVADLDDPLWVKAVELDEACRRQQVDDGCFPDLSSVPRRALTLTVPAILSAGFVCAVVPGPRKAAALRDALCGPVGPGCPASALRQHADTLLCCDAAAAAELPPPDGGLAAGGWGREDGGEGGPPTR